ncbi:hypothetical protein PoB_002919600 [Plakobranchus ocellatus]|uniref:Uncharacterized protein n=1 Tax=Plakobranchus ocellatus TaxID=259542 RepID=A0AAV4A3B2_9GAST|nr:hypothetical protein PoB_002919600 [Plakobranchus ocellatus]
MVVVVAVVVGVIVLVVLVLAEMVVIVVVMVMAMSGVAVMRMKVVLAIILQMVVIVVMVVVMQKASLKMVPAVGGTVNRKFASDLKGVFCHGQRNALLRKTAEENFEVLICHLLTVTKLQKVCQMTAGELQPHTRILKQLVRQRQSLQKKTASRKKDPAYQREKSLRYLKTVKSLFVFPWHFRIERHLHIRPGARDVFAPAAAVPFRLENIHKSDVAGVLHYYESGYLMVAIIRGECQLHLAENTEEISSHNCGQEMSERWAVLQQKGDSGLGRAPEIEVETNILHPHSETIPKRCQNIEITARSRL